jgi:hypothetical protein
VGPAVFFWGGEAVWESGLVVERPSFQVHFEEEFTLDTFASFVCKELFIGLEATIVVFDRPGHFE